jgi:hypothetical protein
MMNAALLMVPVNNGYSESESDHSANTLALLKFMGTLLL